MKSQKLTFIGVLNSSDPHISAEDHLYDKYHRSDIAAVINTDDMKIEKKYKTKKNERILYADLEKVITYYHGKYITRSMKDQKKLRTQKAREIKKNGKYSFDICGGCIFVFDDNTCKVINKISIE